MEALAGLVLVVVRPSSLAHLMEGARRQRAAFATGAR